MFKFLPRLCILLVLAASVICEEWTLREKYTYFESSYISSALNSSIVDSVRTVRSKLQCFETCRTADSPSLYFVNSDNTCYCNTQADNATVLTNMNTGVRYGWAANSAKKYRMLTNIQIEVAPTARDCLVLYNWGFYVNGVYEIKPTGGNKVLAWCDMTNGGWTVFQRRQDGSENFYRMWPDYVAGFGNQTSEYWLGLETLHLLTLQPSRMRIDMETFGDVTPTSGFAEYSSFQIGPVATYYTMFVSGYVGNAGESLIQWHNGKTFKTYEIAPVCAVPYAGAWWYGDSLDVCHLSNLNGLYLGGVHGTFANGVNWKNPWGYNYSLKTTVMKVKRI